MSTKAQTLLSLQNKLNHARILDLVFFEVKEWDQDKSNILEKISSKFGTKIKFIARSSALMEDQNNQSCAGKYTSILNLPFEELEAAINKIILSYGSTKSLSDQILIQPMLQDMAMTGVLFTFDPSANSPYYIINYETSGDSEAVTSGKKGPLETQIIARSSKTPTNKRFDQLLMLAKELEKKLHNNALDIEFAFDKHDNLYLFQVRPLIVNKEAVEATNHEGDLKQIADKIAALNSEHPYLYGKRTIFGIMPDWNPAEIIGVRPRPLALSLYKELITDNTWAYQRDNYGYTNLRSFPLLIDFMGLPYIDTRVSFNSFIPKSLDSELAERLVNYYLDTLADNPALHDKVEFDIVYSCYTLDLEERLLKLKDYGFSDNDLSEISMSLKNLTNCIINRENGLWIHDIEKISELQKRHETIFFNSDFDEITKIYWMLEDCKRYGTLPFAGLARAGFIAVQILKSLVTVGVLSPKQYMSFMNNLDSVSTQMTIDLHSLDKQMFLHKYGHLRPGTYDILSLRYDEAPDLYFDWDKLKNSKHAKKSEFSLSLSQMQEIEKLLTKHGLEHDVVGLFSFIKTAIEGREYSKFVFTKTLSDIISLVKSLGNKNQISIDDLSYLNIQTIISLYGSSWDVKTSMNDCIASGKIKYNTTSSIILPPVIVESDDIWNFGLPDNIPNFITTKNVTAPVVLDLNDTSAMPGAFIFIPSADPGFDWIFTHNIAGFVTKYGGVNSHMAIRAGELGLPAIIGAGEKLYKEWSKASKLYVDCNNQRVEVLH